MTAIFPVPRTARFRGAALIVLGLVIATTMIAGVNSGLSFSASLLFGWIALVGTGFVIAGACFVFKGYMPRPVKWSMIGMVIITAAFLLFYLNGFVRLGA